MKYYTPDQDLEGLLANEEIDPNLPNVLIIGDSISIGYTPPVRELLKGTANVFRPDTNCGDTRYGVDAIDTWMGPVEWDVVHFNFGLHDIAYRNPESTEVGNRDKINGKLSVTPEIYTQNLTEIARKIKLRAKKVIFAATTIVPEGEVGRFAGDEVKYNELARQVMEEQGILINDLYAQTAGFSEDLFVGPGNVHFTKEGYQLLGEQVSRLIAGQL